jgi:hypothetical protein
MKAAERDTSVSALVREFLTRLAEDGDSDFARRKRLQDEVIASIKAFSAGDRVSRDEIYERNAVR